MNHIDDIGAVQTPAPDPESQPALEAASEATTEAASDGASEAASDGAAPAPGKKPRRHLIKPRWLRITLKSIMWLIIAIILLPLLIYVPPVQDWLKDVACSQIKEATGLEATIGKFRLKFPLDVSLEEVTVLDATRDTMVNAERLIADVKVLPLFKGDVDLNKLTLNKGYYHMVAEDSSMNMTLRAGYLKVDGGSRMNLNSQNINLLNPELKDAIIRVDMDVWKSTPDTVYEPGTMVIKANKMKLENVTYAMSMLPTIKDLSAHFDSGEVSDATIDLVTSNVKIGSFTASGSDVNFIVPTADYVASHPAPVDTISVEKPPMTVQLDSIDVQKMHVVYASDGVKASPGFDAGYIELSDMSINISDFYNCASEVRVPINSLTGKERCGLAIKEGSGTLSVDDSGIGLSEFKVKTPYSSLSADATLTYAAMGMEPDGALRAKASGYVGYEDIVSFMPSLRSTLKLLPGGSPVGLDIDIAGSLQQLSVNNLGIDMPKLLRLKAGGFVENALNPANLIMHLTLDGALKNASPLNSMLSGMGVALPAFTISGSVDANHSRYGADLDVRSSSGGLALAGEVSLDAERYEADVTVDNFNVAAIMPTLGVGVVDGSLYASGAGFNPTKAGAYTTVRADVGTAVYEGVNYGPLTLDADLAESTYDLVLAAANPMMDLDLEADGSIEGGRYTIDCEADIRNLDLKGLHLMDEACGGNGWISLSGSANPDAMLFDLDLAVRDIDWTYGERVVSLPYAADGRFLATEESTFLSLAGENVDLRFQSDEGLQSVLDKATKAGDLVSGQIDSRQIDFDLLQQALPPFTISADIGGEGLVSKLLDGTEIGFDRFQANISNTDKLHMDFDVSALRSGDILIDSITGNMNQRDARMDYKVHMGNTPPNMPDFARVDLSGYVGGNRASLAVRQWNDKGENGYKVGLTAALVDSVISIHFTPLNAVIGYKSWTINDDNYIELGPGNAINASIDADGEGDSCIKLISGLTDEGHNYLDASIKKLLIQDFLNISAFAPPMTGELNTDLHIELRPHGVVGNGNLVLNDFTYEKKRIGNLGAEFRGGSNITDKSGAKINFTLDGEEIMDLRGFMGTDSLGNKETTRLRLELTHFPLRIVNPFLDKDMMQLEGCLTGNLALTGTLTSPLLNGEVKTDSVAVYLPICASRLRFDDTKSISVADNLLRFDSYTLKGANDNPLTLDGYVDARNLSNILLDLSLNGNNVVLIDNDKRAHSDIYGKLAVNFNAAVKGSLSKMDITGRLSVLPSTDLVYVMSTTSTALEQQTTTDVVKFVSFNDTVAAPIDTVESNMAMKISFALNIVNGAKVTVNLNSSGTNRAQIQPYGDLVYSQSYMGDSRLDGQLNFASGQVRYTPPLMSEKVFDIDESSYVAFSGDMMNPTLNLVANDRMKANVQQSGSNSRLIYFDVGLNVTGTLENMKVLFDLSTNDDVTVQNELLSMSAEQRSTAAMNLLLYNTYTGSSVSATSTFGNPLYSFLAGQLNAWAAKTIRGVDLSFGIDQYTNTVDGESSTATSYSYQVSKSLFDNRFKIVVGGNYSTDTNAEDNFAQNLISDISFEYMLKQSTNLNMYVKLFRHTGWESILEGEVTETGVGLVMKRKLNNLRQLFRFRRRGSSNKSATTSVDSLLIEAVNASPSTLTPDSTSAQ